MSSARDLDEADYNGLLVLGNRTEAMQRQPGQQKMPPSSIHKAGSLIAIGCREIWKANCRALIDLSEAVVTQDKGAELVMFIACVGR